MSSVPASADRLVGDDADRAAVDRRERRDEVRRPSGRAPRAARRRRQGPGSRRGRRSCPSTTAGSPRRPRVSSRSGGSSVGHRGGSSSLFDGQVAEQLLDRRDRPPRRSGTTQAGRAGVAGVRGGPAELHVVDRDAGELGDHRRAAHERVGGRRSSPRSRRCPSSNAGPDTAGPLTTMMVGTTPEQSVSARAASPHPCSADMPSAMSAPDEPMTATSGKPLRRRRSRAAASITDDDSDDSAPRRRLASTSSQTTGATAELAHIDAHALPGTCLAQGDRPHRRHHR